MNYAERRRKREAERVLARDAIRLNPIMWAPAPVSAVSARRVTLDASYAEHRRRNRPFRSAFSGIYPQSQRKILWGLGR